MIVKYGGNAMKSPELRRAVARELAALGREQPLVVVHGGGPVIERELALRGIKSEFVRGLRVTTPAAMQIIMMALGQLNKELSWEIGGAAGAARATIRGCWWPNRWAANWAGWARS